MLPILPVMFRILAFLLFIPTVLTAQTHTHKFELKTIPPTSLNPSISHIRVIDNRLTQDHFGYIIDNSTRKQKLVTDSSFQNSLESFLNKHFVNTYTNADTLLFIIRNLYLEHKPANTDLGTIYIHADFYRGRNDRYYPLHHIDSFYQLEGRTSIGLLSKLDELLGAYTIHSLADSLYNTALTALSCQAATTFVTDTKNTYPLYNTATYKRGVYMNWQEMLIQTPSVTDFKMVYYGALDNAAPGPYLFNKKGERGERIKPDRYYAVYDGRKWHKSTPDGFAAISYIKGDYYIDAKFGEKASDEERMIIMLFGITGYFVYKVTGANKNKQSDLIYGKLLMKIDYNTGKLIPVRMIP